MTRGIPRATWHPKLVTLAHQLAKSRNLPWGPQSPAMSHLTEYGKQAGQAWLERLYASNPAAWLTLGEAGRDKGALLAASRAMAIHLVGQTAPVAR